MNPDDRSSRPAKLVWFLGCERARLLAWIAVACTVSFACSSSREVEQPVAFQHKVHVAEEEIPCTDCHEGAEDADHATIPVAELCADCHEEAIGESPEEAKLVLFVENEEAIPWVRVHRLDEHVHFSHRRHVVAGRILCERCHGEVAEREIPFAQPFLSFEGELGMERCVGCHLESGNPRASIDCALCHR
jgi:hypothetical protein